MFFSLLFSFHKCCINFLVFAPTVIVSVTLLTYLSFFLFAEFLHLFFINLYLVRFALKLTLSLSSFYISCLHQAYLHFPWLDFSFSCWALCNPKAQAPSLAYGTTQFIVQARLNYALCSSRAQLVNLGCIM